MSLAKGILTGLSLCAIGLIATPQTAEAGVVVRSSGPSAAQYTVGREIGDNERITLSDGDIVTVLDNGGTRVFRGAGTFMLSTRSGASRNSAFGALTTQRTARRARTGAVRGVTTITVSNPLLWYVDVAASGTICLPDDSNVRLWRASTQAESSYSLSTDDVESTITFPAGEMLAAWDIYNPPVEGTTYRIGHGAGNNAVEVNFVFLEETPETAEEMANTLIANGCMVQLEQLSNATISE